MLASPQAKEQITLRSVIVGLFVGTLMCLTNMYFGLQTGWVTMGSLQSAILGFGIFKLLQKVGLGHDFTIAENVIVQVRIRRTLTSLLIRHRLAAHALCPLQIAQCAPILLLHACTPGCSALCTQQMYADCVQTTSVATATMPLAAGFVGVIPAMAMLTPDENPPHGSYTFTPLQLMLWSLVLACFGVFAAVPLRTQVIEHEELRFPSGTATAEVIRALHSSSGSCTATQPYIGARAATTSHCLGANGSKQLWNASVPRRRSPSASGAAGRGGIMSATIPEVELSASLSDIESRPLVCRLVLPACCNEMCLSHTV